MQQSRDHAEQDAELVSSLHSAPVAVVGGAIVTFCRLARTALQ